jgi:hypothetical protein
MIMRVPCAKKLDLIVDGLSFLVPVLTSCQFNNMTVIGTALILSSRFKLVDFRSMWLGKRSVSALSIFFSDSKFSFYDMNAAFTKRVFEIYLLKKGGYFIIDDKMEHHTKLCEMIYGVFWLFDHAFGSNLKAKCITVLYYSDGCLIKFPIGNRIFISLKKRLKPPPLGGQISSFTK